MKIVDYLPSLTSDKVNDETARKLYDQVKDLCKKYDFKILTRADNEKKS